MAPATEIEKGPRVRSEQGQGAPPLLDVRGLKTQFRTPLGIVTAVNDVSFQVKAGETLGVVGESGCGKSMTGLSIMRLVPAPHGRIAGGSVLFEGKDLLTVSKREIEDIRGSRIAMIFQDPMTSLNPVMTISRQIGESLERHMGLTRKMAAARAVELLKMVGIPNAAEGVDQYPHQFSGGMRQRVVIAIALACEPKLIIADEPTTALDVTIQAQILDLLRLLQAERETGVIMISHSMGVVAGIADRVQVMYAGSIVETGPTESVFADPRHPYTVGLMRSIPRIDSARNDRLEPIRGLPPDLIDLPDVCPFAPRCNHASETCWKSRPPLQKVSDEHLSACWHWNEVSKAGGSGRARMGKSMVTA